MEMVDMVVVSMVFVVMAVVVVVEVELIDDHVRFGMHHWLKFSQPP